MVNVNHAGFSTAKKQFAEYETADLLEMLNAPGMLYRVNALTELVRRSTDDTALLPWIVDAITKPNNLESRIMGTISVSHVGVGSLLKTENPAIVAVAQSLIQTWPEYDHADLMWYLRTENLVAN